MDQQQTHGGAHQTASQEDVQEVFWQFKWFTCFLSYLKKGFLFVFPKLFRAIHSKTCILNNCVQNNSQGPICVNTKANCFIEFKWITFPNSSKLITVLGIDPFFLGHQSIPVKFHTIIGLNNWLQGSAYCLKIQYDHYCIVMPYNKLWIGQPWLMDKPLLIIRI